MTLYVGRDGGENTIPLNAVDQYVGGRLRARREFMQMSEEWLAGHLEVSVNQLLAMEAGECRIGFELLLRAADALDVAERYFYLGFGRKDPDAGPPSKSWLRDVDRWFSANLFPHEGALLAVARRMTGNTETARDVVQDAYADVLRNEKWRAIENPRAYAMKAVRSLAGRLLQRARIVPIELLANMEEVGHMDLSPDAYEVLSAKQRRQLVLDAIDALPPQCRRVVKLRRLAEMLPKDIAREMDISVSMVEKHLARGMAAIADKLAEHEPQRMQDASSSTPNSAAAE